MARHQPKAAASHRVRLIEELRADPNLAREYLAAAIEDDDPSVLLSALFTVAEAQGMRGWRKPPVFRARALPRHLAEGQSPALGNLAVTFGTSPFGGRR